MFQRILVPLDGSTRAEQVLPIAARLARVSRGTITLLRIVDFTQDALAYYGMSVPYAVQSLVDDQFSSARNYLEQLRRHRYLEGIAIQTQVVQGNPAEMIVSQAAEASADLIVISSHGYTGVKRWVMGSIAEKVARHAFSPVLIVRDGSPLRTHRNVGHCGCIRALVPLDASTRSRDVLVPAAELVTALSGTEQGELHLARMLKVSEEANAEHRNELFQEASQNFAAVSQSVRDELIARFGPEMHPTLSWSISLTNDIAEGIVLMAENGEASADSCPTAPCDLIALTTHGASSVLKWPIGGIAERVLHLTRLPVLVVRPEDIRARAHQRHPAEAAV